eukprot:767836-Hanusia_phi.AAC.3
MADDQRSVSLPALPISSGRAGDLHHGGGVRHCVVKDSVQVLALRCYSPVELEATRSGRSEESARASSPSTSSPTTSW